VIEPDSYSYPRYLNAKRSVDARALNRQVWTDFLEALPDDSSSLRILEVGGGVGATFERVVEALDETRHHSLWYTLVDREQDNIQAARQHVFKWGREQGYQVSSTEDGIRLSDSHFDVRLTLVKDDVYRYAEESKTAVFDVVIAQAVLDLFDLSNVLSSLRPLLTSGGLWYLPIHFDGVTGFEPMVSSQLDEKIERLYHNSMTPDSSGEGPRAYTGRRLFTALHQMDNEVLSAGSSDWVVFPRGNEYPNEEAYFLHHSLHFIEEELSDHSEIDSNDFPRWIETRRQQIDHGELIYIAHQMDVLAKKK